MQAKKIFIFGQTPEKRQNFKGEMPKSLMPKIMYGWSSSLFGEDLNQFTPSYCLPAPIKILCIDALNDTQLMSECNGIQGCIKHL